MKSCSSIYSKTLGKFLKRYKLTKREKEGILKVVQKRPTLHFVLSGLARIIKLKVSIANKNKRL